jgi:predicted NBD/HSP70 family sugar kinase
VEELLARSGVDRQRVVGVGVAVSESLACEWAKPPGAVASQHTPPPLQFLRFGSSTVPVFFDHMARTLSQAESWFAGVRGTHGTLTVVIDTGISAAMAGDGMTRPMPPARLIGLGHTVISYRGRPCRCGSLGCLDAYAGVTGILDRYRRTAGNRVCHDREERRALATLVDSATRSRTARKVLAEAAGYLGAGIGGLINLLDPDRVLLGGWAGQLLGAVVLGEIREAARDHSVRRDHDRTTIQLCPPGPEMAERGAATLPIMALFLAGGDTITTTVGDP